MSAPAIAIIRVQALPGQTAALGACLSEVLEQVRRHPGCQSGELQALDANRWQISTRGTNQAELDAHLRAPKAPRWLGQLGCGALALGLELESRSAD